MIVCHNSGGPKSMPIERWKKFAVLYVWLAPSQPMLLLSLMLMLLLPLIDYHQNCIQLVHGYLAPPNRSLPAELIVLENGSTTYISSSLEEFLDSTTPSTPRLNITHQSLPIVSAQPEPEDRKQLVHRQSQLERESDTTRQVASLSQPQPQPQQQQQHQNSDRQRDKEKANHHESEKHHTDGNKKPINGTKPILEHWQVKSLLNATLDFPLEYSQIIFGYVWPLIAAITLFTNLMIVFVLTQRDMRTPTNVVLTAIAIADIIPIMVPVPWFVYLFAMGDGDEMKQVLYPPMTCYFYQHSTRSVSEIFYFLSTWLNVLLAIQDYLTACWPKLAKKYCQIRVVIIEIVALTLLAFLLNLPQLLKLVFRPVQFYYKGQLTWGCKALQAKWFKELFGHYVALYDDIFTAIIVVFVDGGPAIVLVTLTILLIRQLHMQRIKGHLLMEQARTASKRRRERHRQQEYEASARVMIFVLLAFLAVKIPFATTYSLMIIQSRFEIHFVENLVDFQKAITLTDLVFVLSYPINFTIFCGCSKKFRHKCAQLLGECNHNTNAAKNRLMSSFSSSFNSDISQHYNHQTSHTSHNSQNQNEAKNYRKISQQLNNNPESNNKRDSSVSLLLNGEGGIYSNNKRDFMTTTGAIICCNGSSEGRKLSQPQSPLASSGNQSYRGSSQGETGSGGDDDRQPPYRRIQQHPSPIPEDVSGAGSQESVRALAEDGGLCVECIMRYEQIRRSSGSIAASSHYSSQHQHQHQQSQPQPQQHQRRLSTDSAGSSWHVSLPPPPPPLQFCIQAPGGQQQLPHIVTTRCDSIREGSIPDDMQQQPAICAGDEIEPLMLASRPSLDGSGQLSVAPGASVATDQRSTIETTEPNSGIEIETEPEIADAGEPRGRIQSRRLAGSSARGSSDPGTIRGATMRQLSIAGYGGDDDDEHGRRGYHGRSASHSNESISSAGCFLGGQARGDKSRRGADYEEDDDDDDEHIDRRTGKHLRAPTLAQIENKHRSLSMSNSKLSALAGATGLLADIIKSTCLLTTSPAASGSLSSDKQSRQQQQQKQRNRR